MRVNDPSSRTFLVVLCVTLGTFSGVNAQETIPHGQTSPPGKALSPAEAVARMTVPEGFTVEVVASEPDLVNPVAMTFDDRGRVWVTESLEYPRRQPGPGRDRVKVLEDTNGDGKADRFTLFAEGLNIPSGIAVGHGGVWVANAPDILFLQDTDGDGKADTREVVVTGFGRDDTHELPNSLTWGPDGWLYGWNGVFNRSVVKHRGKTHDFTCAIFRIHPKTRDFEIFCEGTSNPWGIAFDREGAAFASACVIDHLWHLTESGYYHRQGGPYPPFTWKIESIVDFKHQKAAYCGIHYYDSDAYPLAYREKLFMGNIHGNCLNVDSLTRKGSTYQGKTEPDFLSAHDAWFMPVSQKTGPDGSLYVLDWYDRYHCYQDANRDPAGIDRLKGRLYRIRYKDTPRRWNFDLARSTDDKLVDLLGSGNGFDRDAARRLLVERGPGATDAPLQALAIAPEVARRTRLNALWTLVGRGPLPKDFHMTILNHEDPGFRAWGVRAAGNQDGVDPKVLARIAAMASDPSPDVALQVAIAARKIPGVTPVPWLTEVASAGEKDPLIPKIVWSNLHPLLDDPANLHAFAEEVNADRARNAPGLREILPRVIDRVIGKARATAPDAFKLLTILMESGDGPRARQALQMLAGRVQSGELAGPDLAACREAFGGLAGNVSAVAKSLELEDDVAFLAASWNDPVASEQARTVFRTTQAPEERRLRALNALVVGGDPGLIATVERLLADTSSSPGFLGSLIAALGRLDDPKVASMLLGVFPRLPDEVQPRVVELLTQRESWSLGLLEAMAKGSVPKALVNVNQARRLQGSRDPVVARRSREVYGVVREERNRQREQTIAAVRSQLLRQEGDPVAGVKVYERVCGQCHKLHGQGQEVGPEITLNGRGSFDQLLSNVFDPSLVIGEGYQATTVATLDGRIITGLLVESNPDRLVLKLQGGKVETIPTAQVDERKVSPLSLMPEDLEKQILPQELADLFAYITLDRPPSDSRARPIPGSEGLKRKSPSQ